jgi:ribokinase
MATETVSVAVVGSINLDLVARVKRFALPGETLTGATVSRHPGGKGANQAVAARRLGATVFMVGCVGDDTEAEPALAGLRAAGVDVTCCRSLPGVATGMGIIQVTDAGENLIVVAPGANAAFAPEHLQLPEADCMIAQLEVQDATLLAAARQHRGLFCLNAAPVRPSAAELLQRTDLLVVNEGEAREFRQQIERYSGLLAITLGSRGALLQQNGTEIARADSARVQVVDTTGAGDAFTAALAVGLAQGMPPAQALQRACLAGALATTRPGAQTSPTLAELFAFRP